MSTHTKTHTKTRISRDARIAVALVGTCCLGSACNDTKATIPDNDTTPPVITLSDLGVAGVAVDHDPIMSGVAANQTVIVTVPGARDCAIPQVLILGSATNPGAVRSFHITVQDSAAPNPPLFDVTTTQDPDSNNQAFTILRLLSADNGDPLRVSFGAGTCPRDQTFHVSARSTNFSGVGSTLDYDLVGSGLPVGGCNCN